MDGFQQYKQVFSSCLSQGFVDEYILKEKVNRLIRWTTKIRNAGKKDIVTRARAWRDDTVVR